LPSAHFLFFALECDPLDVEFETFELPSRTTISFLPVCQFPRENTRLNLRRVLLPCSVQLDSLRHTFTIS
jgi:hypothetical protein